LEQAAKFVSAWVDYLNNEPKAPQLAQLAEWGRAVIDAGCDDPLVQFIHARTSSLLNKREGRQQLWEQVSRIAGRLDQPAYPRWLAYRGHLLYIETGTEFAEPHLLVQHRQAAIRAAVEALSDDLPAGAQYVLHDDLEQHLKGPLAASTVELLEALAAAPKADPWMYRMLSAEEHYRIGWAARGKGMADTVTPEGWKIFTERLQAARVLFLEAWQMHPEHPHAAKKLIPVIHNLGGVAGEDARFWFDEAVRAEFDYAPAYNQYLWSLLPRWGGSLMEMLAFGRECVATGRFDTDVPWFFYGLMLTIRQEMGESNAVFALDEVYESFRDMANGYAQLPGNESRKSYYRSIVACIAWLGQRMDDVQQICHELGPDLNPQPFANFRVDPDELLQAVDALAAPAETKFAELGHKVMALALSRDGATFWTAAANGEIAQWDLATGGRLAALPDHRGLLAVAISPDGAWLATAGQDGEARLHDANNPQQASTLLDAARVTAVAFSADGELVAIASLSANPLSQIQIWKTKTAESMGVIEPQGMFVTALAFSPDGRQLAAARDRLTSKFSWLTGDVVSYDLSAREQTASLPAFQGKVTQLAFSSDGQRLAMGGKEVLSSTAQGIRWRHAIRMVNLADGAFSGFLGHAGEINGLHFLHEDRHLISCSSDGTIRLWDTAPLQSDQPQACLFFGHAAAVTAVASDGKGQTLVSGDSLGRLLQWDISTAKLQSQIQAGIGSFLFKGGVKELRRLPGEEGLAVASMTHGMSLWRLRDGLTKARAHNLRPDRVTIDADVSADGQSIGLVLRHHDNATSLPLVNADNGQILGQLDQHVSQPTCVRFSPDGKTIACGTAARQVVLLNASSRQPWAWGTLTGHAGVLGRLAFSADGRRLASGDDQGMVKVWRLPEDPPSQREALKSEHTLQMPSVIHCLAFSPLGDRLAAGYAQTQVWDLQTGRKLQELPGQEASFSRTAP
jgi:WD40 repeat protein